MTVLCATDVFYHVHRGEALVRGVSLSLHEGEKVALVGPNGSGKTTLLRLLTGVLPPTQGAIEVRGKPLRAYRRKALARELAYLPQDTPLMFELTVGEVVAQGCYALDHLPWAEKQKAVHSAMALTEIRHLEHRALPTLSGGERQRVFIARAMAQGAPILLLDEPTTALDIRHALDVLELMEHLSRQGVTLVAAMHDLEAAARHFDRVIVLEKGAVLTDGPPQQVFEDLRVAQCFGVVMQVEENPDGSLKALHCRKPAPAGNPPSPLKGRRKPTNHF